MRKKFALMVTALAVLLSSLVGLQASPAAAVVDAGHSKYIYMGVDARLGTTVWLEFSTSRRSARFYKVKYWTEVRQANGSFAVAQVCGNQNLEFDLKVRGINGTPTPDPASQGQVVFGGWNEVSGGPFVSTWANTWRDRTQYELSVVSAYDGTQVYQPCPPTQAVSRSLTFVDTEWP